MKWFLILVVLIIACSKQGSKPVKEKPKGEEISLNISVKDYGQIKIKLHSKEAPQNVSNIVKLAQKGFYDGLTFHRIIPGFVIQGGCPRGDGRGSPGYTVDDEISPNLKHLRGTVAMANSGPNTNGCQFYICLSDLPRLDGRYTIIGEVVAGMDAVEKIATVKTGDGDRPLEKVIMEKVWITP